MAAAAIAGGEEFGWDLRFDVLVEMREIPSNLCNSR
jgi:hypothetical protein